MRWYRTNGRHELPWRLTRDPYAVLISEVMLQQTQVERVRPYYEAWLNRWPDFASLAAASPADVIREWRGLGYNRRALSLHRLALAVVADHGGVLPIDAAQLRALPGIGPYTAAALRSFAWEEHGAVSDTNIARVVARAALGAPKQKLVPANRLQPAIDALLPRRSFRDHNLALMDLGALVCTARRPSCERCPLTRLCRWRGNGYPAAPLRELSAEKFESTSRYARGRIIDELREAPATTEELAARLTESHRKLTTAYLRALAKDGMIVETHGVWSLPS